MEENEGQKRSAFETFEYKHSSVVQGRSEAPSAMTRRRNPHAEGRGLDDDSSQRKEERYQKRLIACASSLKGKSFNRFFAFRNSKFSANSVKSIIGRATGVTKMKEEVAIATLGVAKVLVGELVEGGLDIMRELGESGPLQPKHIRAAYERLAKNGSALLHSVQHRRS